MSIPTQQINKSADKPTTVSAEPEILVEVSNVSKKFARRLMTSLKYGAIDILREVLGLPLKETLRKNEFWAVKDVSFTLRYIADAERMSGQQTELMPELKRH